MTTDAPDLMELATKLEQFNSKARRVIENDAGLSAQGSAISLALLVTLNVEAFEKIPAALRALANKGQPT